tara:strand:+ start:699 stop:2312 length:1614 start_codon:yes stop_codon:yes gene_type:complete
MANVDIQDKYIYKINGADYFCKFQLVTNTGLGQATEKDFEYVDFNKSAIVSLDLVENFFEPFTTASVTVNNPFDYVDNKVFTRGDGRDQFHICMYDAAVDETNVEQERLDYRFVIVGENNSVSKTDRSNNFKTYSLIDINYFKLNEAIPAGKKYSGKVGKIIRDILVEQLAGDGGTASDVIGAWEDGDHEILNREIPEAIIPSSGWRYSDVIKYLLRIYYYNVGGADGLPVQGVLKFDRFKKKYTLQPISKIFEMNHLLTYEAFGAGDMTGGLSKNTQHDNKNNPSQVKAGIRQKVATGSTFDPEFGAEVEDYEYMDTPGVRVYNYTTQLRNTNLTTPMANYSNEFFTNYSIGYTDAKLGNQYQTQVIIDDVKKLWKEHFVEVFKLQGGRPRPFLPLTTEKDRIYKPFITPFEGETAVALAKAQMVSNLTFLNLQLNIDNLGNTNRRPGTFMDIFNLHTNKISPGFLDEKLLGRWFITSVRHRFFKDSYQTVLQCIKPYVGPEAEGAEVTSTDPLESDINATTGPNQPSKVDRFIKL